MTVRLLMLLAVVAVVVVGDVAAYNILFFHNAGTRSHLHVMFPIAEELLERGHTVTGAFFSPSGIQHPNYTEILLPDIVTEAMTSLSKVMMEQGSETSILNYRILSRAYASWDYILDRAVEFMQNPHFQSILQQKFDMIVEIGGLGSFLAEVLDCPITIVMPAGPMHTITNYLGTPFNPAHQAVLSSKMTDPTVFSQRLANVALYLGFGLFSKVTSYAITSGLRSRLGYEGPSITEAMASRTQLLLANSHVVTHPPIPLMESVVQIGGVHIKPSKPLPPDLQQFLDAAPQGAILVSFGSAIQPSSMTEEKRQIFLDTFKALDLPIIWKWDAEVSGLPPNIMVSKWLPQQDLLAHPNLKVFVTHGGLLSTMEAIHFETVIVGIPFGNDQVPNLLRAEQHNIGIMLTWENLNAQSFTAAIRRAMEDREMSTSMKKYSRLFKDVEVHPRKKAAWWIEYAIRNNGTQFFRPASLQLSWYQYLMLDMMAFVLVVLTLLLVSLYLLVRLLAYVCRRKAKTD